MRLSYVARRNLLRKPARTLLLAAIVAVVSCTLFAATLFLRSIGNALRIGTYRLGADVLVVPAGAETAAKAALLSGEPTHFLMDAAVLGHVRGVEGVRAATPQLFIKPTSFTCCFNVDVFLVAFDPETDFTVRPWLRRHLDRPLRPDEIVTGREVPVVGGERMPFFGTEFTVAGTMEPTGMDFFDRSAFMSLEGAYRMAEASRTKAIEPIELGRDRISAVLVQTSDEFTPDRVAIRIEHDVPGVRAIVSDAVVSTVRRQLGGLIRAVLGISGVLWAIVLLIMTFAFSMIVAERRREIGLLRAVGASRGHIAALLLTEAGLLAAAGAAIGTALGYAALFGFKGVILHRLRLPYLFPPAGDLAALTAAALAVAVGTGLLAALLPVRAALASDPYDAIQGNE